MDTSEKEVNALIGIYSEKLSGSVLETEEVAKELREFAEEIIARYV